ncbi:MAG: UDP-N-acetylmuramoyl-L-alanine--D-glutamate ligase [Patescibacteria group bacterium]|jgi:UDP-N-acetylmuramoylalanine--D-glutamate ligase
MTWKLKLQKLNKQKIALLGLGLDNQALLILLNAAKIKAPITICDARPKNKLSIPKLKNLKINYQLEKEFNKNLYKFDLLFRSPGWPLSCPGVKEALKKGQTKINSPLNLFFSLTATKNIIGVTGSKGKGTTATLIYKILKDAGRRVFLGGNIGVAPLSFVTKIQPSDYVILELSSFQLEDLKYSPRIAVITNLFPEHLAPADPYNPNFHHSYAAYWRAKLNIAAHQDNHYLVVNNRLKTKLKNKATDENLPGKKIYFKTSSLPSKLMGSYNQENIAAAVEVAKLLKIKTAKYKKAIANFNNLEHRLELARSKNGVNYFDNSFSTTPESTILDLKSFTGPIILIAGGADKGADFRALAKVIKNKVKFLVLLTGQATPRITKNLLSLKFTPTKMIEVDSMEKAVMLAHNQAKPGDTVLLSTACASFGLFKNYKERGELFKKYVRKITNDLKQI